MKRFLVAMLGGLFSPLLWAQQPPGTDVYLLDLTAGPDAAPKNISNRPGYDNQPQFSPDGQRVYFTRIAAAGEGFQADIWQYDRNDDALSAVTESPESEYSPTPMPGRNSLSVIRVGSDNKQLLWSIPLDGAEPELLLPEVEPVGYHAWANERDLVLFVLGEPMTLQGASVGGPARLLAENIARGMQPLQEANQAAFIQVRGEQDWMIMAVDVTTDEVTALIATRPGSQDFAVAPDGRIWMGQQSALYVTRSTPDGLEWELHGDLERHGISNITRLAISPDGQTLALVSDEPAE